MISSSMVVRVGRLRAATWTHWVTLAISAIVLLQVNRDNWFLLDEWSFVIDRAVVGGPDRLGIWVPHNEHLSVAPTFVYRTLVELMGVNDYWPYLAVLIAVHLAVAHLLWRVIRRSVADPWVATAGVAVLLFLGAGAENLARAFQMTLLGSLAAGLAWLLVMPSTPGFSLRRDIAGWALGLLALLCSGVGIAMVGVAALYALLCRGWRSALVVASVPTAGYMLWWAIYGREHFADLEGQPLGDGIQDVPAYLWEGLTASLDATLGLAGAGVVVVLAVVVWSARRARPVEPAWALALACAAGALTQLALTAVRRSHLGIEWTANSRYTYLTIALLLPLLCLMVDRALPLRSHLVVLAAGTALVLLVQVPLLVDFAHSWSQAAQQQRRVFHAGVDMALSGEELLSTVPFPYFAPDVQVEDLLTLIDEGALSFSGDVDERAQLTAQTFLQLSAESTDEPAPPQLNGPRVIAFAGVLPVPTETAPGCAQWAPTAAVAVVRLALSGPATLTVTTQRSGSVSASYLSPDSSQSSIQAQSFHADANVPLEIRSAARGVDLHLAFPDEGATTLCGLDSSGPTEP